MELVVKIVVLCLAVLFSALVSMLLWNWLMPEIFNFPVINYLQALGLMILSRLLIHSPSGSGRSSRSRIEE